jgi:hypothetical protein
MRKYTNKLLDAIDEGTIHPVDVVEMCLAYMSEYDVKDMCLANDILLNETEDE